MISRKQRRRLRRGRIKSIRILETTSNHCLNLRKLNPNLVNLQDLLRILHNVKFEANLGDELNSDLIFL